MRKLTLLTSVLLASSFQTVNVSAQCMNTINCQILGYTKTSCTKGGVKCPTGNYWYCPESQCDSSYKYTCTGYMQSPSGTACNGKYRKCNCSNNYVWNASQGLCLACTSLCTGYTLTYEQAVSQCGSSNAFACLDNCTGNRMYKCGTNTGSGSGSGSDSGSEGCTCPDGYNSYKTTGCSKTKTSTCGTTCYQGGVRTPIYMKTCTNAYCGTDRQAYGDCVYERRATPNDPWVVEKTVSDERITGLAPEECLVGGSGKPLGATFTLEAVTVCYD